MRPREMCKMMRAVQASTLNLKPETRNPNAAFAKKHQTRKANMNESNKDTWLYTI
jgi:hypothetical protein